jgi:hypothetical protein
MWIRHLKMALANFTSIFICPRAVPQWEIVEHKKVLTVFIYIDINSYTLIVEFTSTWIASQQSYPRIIFFQISHKSTWIRWVGLHNHLWSSMRVPKSLTTNILNWKISSSKRYTFWMQNPTHWTLPLRIECLSGLLHLQIPPHKLNVNPHTNSLSMSKLSFSPYFPISKILLPLEFHISVVFADSSIVSSL